MSILYRSKRVGKNGRIFTLYKFRTLREDFDKTHRFAKEDAYVPFGRFLRKTKLDELPQLINVIKRDINLFGPRPEEEKTIKLLPAAMKNVLLSIRPGIVDLASLHFYDEEKILKNFQDPHIVYWRHIRPLKFVLQTFYIENRNVFLDIAILYMTFKKVLKSFFK